MSHLFDPFEQRGVTCRNRIVVSPMCQYSSEDGFANDWHLVHLVSRAVGGAGAIVFESSAVTPEGRITPQDIGIWKDAHMLCEVVQAVRKAIPDRMPLWVRISATDWLPDGWDIDQSVALSHKLKFLGVDLIDCSSGGIAPSEKIPVGAGYQTPFAVGVAYRR